MNTKILSYGFSASVETSFTLQRTLTSATASVTYTGYQIALTSTQNIDITENSHSASYVLTIQDGTPTPTISLTKN